MLWYDMAQWSSGCFVRIGLGRLGSLLGKRIPLRSGLPYSKITMSHLNAWAPNDKEQRIATGLDDFKHRMDYTCIVSSGSHLCSFASHLHLCVCVWVMRACSHPFREHMLGRAWFPAIQTECMFCGWTRVAIGNLAAQRSIPQHLFVPLTTQMMPMLIVCVRASEQCRLSDLGKGEDAESGSDRCLLEPFSRS